MMAPPTYAECGEEPDYWKFTEIGQFESASHINWQACMNRAAMADTRGYDQTFIPPSSVATDSVNWVSLGFIAFLIIVIVVGAVLYINQRRNAATDSWDH
jgi:hypothetical protein